MKLFIRSQDKKYLGEITDIQSNDYGSIFGTNNARGIEESIKLGSYEDNQRSLEIINIIHTKIIRYEGKELIMFSMPLE